MPQYTSADTAEDHARLVENLKKKPEDIEFSTVQKDIVHMILGLSGEVGELTDAIKKHVIYGKDLDLDNIVEEMGDIEFYMEGLRLAIMNVGAYRIMRDDILRGNISKLNKRYGEGKYSDAQAKERADKKVEEKIEEHKKHIENELGKRALAAQTFIGLETENIEELEELKEESIPYQKEIYRVQRIVDGGSTIEVTEEQYKKLQAGNALCKDVTYKIVPEDFDTKEEDHF